MVYAVEGHGRQSGLRYVESGWKMNKTIIPVLVILLLSACGDSTEEAADTTLAPTTTASEATTTPVAPTTTTTVALQGHGQFEVTATIVSHETTRDISVWAPDEEGS